MCLDGRKFQRSKQENEKKIIFHQLPAFNDDTGTPPPGPEPPPRAQHTHTHIQAYAQGRDMTRVNPQFLFFLGISERGCYMGRHSSSSVWAPLFLPYVCHLFPVYVHRAAPACRAASPAVLCVLCALCALACCSFEPVEAVTRRWVQLYSLCVSGGVSK